MYNVVIILKPSTEIIRPLRTKKFKSFERVSKISHNAIIPRELSKMPSCCDFVMDSKLGLSEIQIVDGFFWDVGTDSSFNGQLCEAIWFWYG